MQHVVVASNVKSLVEFSQQILRQIPNTKYIVASYIILYPSLVEFSKKMSIKCQKPNNLYQNPFKSYVRFSSKFEAKFQKKNTIKDNFDISI